MNKKMPYENLFDPGGTDKDFGPTAADPASQNLAIQTLNIPNIPQKISHNEIPIKPENTVQFKDNNTLTKAVHLLMSSWPKITDNL